MKKIILIISILFSTLSFSQPNSESKNYTRLYLIFYCKNDTIKLLKTNIEQNISKIDLKPIKSLDGKFEIYSFKTINDKVTEDVSSGYFGPGIEDGFKFNHSFLSFNKEHKTGIKIIIINKKKKMIIDFNINKTSNSEWLPWRIKMKIKFKEGNYEITDPEKPKLTLIK